MWSNHFRDAIVEMIYLVGSQVKYILLPMYLDHDKFADTTRPSRITTFNCFIRLKNTEEGLFGFTA